MILHLIFIKVPMKVEKKEVNVYYTWEQSSGIKDFTSETHNLFKT